MRTAILYGSTHRLKDVDANRRFHFQDISKYSLICRKIRKRIKRFRRNNEDKKETQTDIGGNGDYRRRTHYKLSPLHGRTSRCVGISSLPYLSL